MQIEKSLKELNLSNDNQELASKLQNALEEQKELEDRITRINESIDEKRIKSKEITFDIDELNRQILEQENTMKNSKKSKIKYLQDQMEKVDQDIIDAEKEYQKLLQETKNMNTDDIIEDLEDSDLNERVAFDDTSGYKRANRSISQDANISLKKLSNDISEIRNLIEETGINKSKVKDYLLAVDYHRQKVKDKSMVEDSLYLQRDSLKQEKIRLKKEQRDIDNDKKK